MEREVQHTESVETAVKRVIAEVEECRPTQLGTLQDVIDIEELEELVDSPPQESEEHTQSFSFRYCGHPVTVHSDRTIVIKR
ncbi:HalOD1 output domain-containing protein [Haloarcula sp. 1CSR25-25]|jgi:hypothetical protein|uniref:HalOD1 output domain-containing protein n=1 Tax=Halobacteriales TaxID=2235 RepID=UPI002894D9AB|nr:hypothetical protein [Haloarcula sp. 1CSR25-25]